MKKEFVIKNKRVLITGGAKRLGAACARDLASKGAHIVLHYNTSKEPALKLAEELKENGITVHCIQTDLTNPGQAEKLVDKVNGLAGPIDILLNNASIYPASTIQKMSHLELFANINVNAFSPLCLSRAFAAQTNDGVIINFLDTRIVEYDKLHAAYHLSKRMLAALTRMCALEFAPAVRVNGIAPGLILPPEGKDESYFEQYYDRIPLHAHGSLEDITRTIVFFIESTFITGEIVFVDGGAFMKGNTYGF
ncbi:MAG: SDR family oxidoreductase [Spirochaetales bacterium]|nr:SDR family oxidoreductase [Spirochaetales bacterium]